MNPAHLHLMLNHLPVLGTAFGLALLALAQWKKSDELKRVSLGVLVLVTLLTIPVYLTGEPAEDMTEKLPEGVHAIVEEHEEAAQVAFVAQIVLGVGALGGMIAFRGGRPIPNRFAVSVLAVALVVF